MYPQTYFLVALLIGTVSAKFGFLSQSQAFAAAALAVLIDLDHFFSYLFQRRSLNIREAWNNAIGNHNEETFLHTLKGFVVFSILQSLVFLYNPAWAQVLSIAYWSHLLLDTLHILTRSAAEKYFDICGFGFTVQLTIAELILSVFALLMTVLYWQFT